MSEWEGIEKAAEKLKGYKPFPMVAKGAATVLGVTTYEGQTIIATDQGVFRVEGDKLMKVEPVPGGVVFV